jgi:hypothetical protein
MNYLDNWCDFGWGGSSAWDRAHGGWIWYLIGPPDAPLRSLCIAHHGKAAKHLLYNTPIDMSSHWYRISAKLITVLDLVRPSTLTYKLSITVSSRSHKHILSTPSTNFWCYISAFELDSKKKLQLMLGARPVFGQIDRPGRCLFPSSSSRIDTLLSRWIKM